MFGTLLKSPSLRHSNLIRCGCCLYAGRFHSVVEFQLFLRSGDADRYVLLRHTKLPPSSRFFSLSTSKPQNPPLTYTHHSPFHGVGNSLLLYGGTEGIFASSQSFIRFESITLWSTNDASRKRRSKGLVQAVIFEASDRNNIGGSAYGGQRSILPLQQHCKTVVMVLGLREMVFWYLDYANFNSTGDMPAVTQIEIQECNRYLLRPLALTTWVVVVGAFRKTVSQILCVSMDLGLLSPLLVLLVGVSYFIASEMLDIAENVGIIDEQNFSLSCLMPSSMHFSYCGSLPLFRKHWNSTYRTSVKLDIYRKFSNALTVLVVVSAAWIVYEMPVTQCIVPVCEMVVNEEVQCLTGGKQDGDISLEKNTGSDTKEEDKRE
ncbi:hypothetical protein IGI04_007792 [Brassica rapa subsp. trilocularis]|uniref:GOST seven transmembrane domain-containing protein n=1 Tax=Brassica rapa subsp. trilocularis TaxID=1813537 RepID=A0ABQ7NKQ1_BRACM|nr:hypothetical protein IGI04_007792 [Brassica rapa subsp. trilocularis]